MITYNIKLSSVIDMYRYLGLFDLSPETILTPGSVRLDSRTGEFTLIPLEKDAILLDSIDEFLKRVYFLKNPRLGYIPRGLKSEEYEEIVCNTLESVFGAIPRSKLEPGKVYFGECRNSDLAIWLGDRFEYVRYKFGQSFLERINHYEDDNDYDLFVPLGERDDEKWIREYEKIKQGNRS